VSDDVPPDPTLALLWGRSTEQRSRRKRVLDGDAIVDTAIDLADRDGLDAVVMTAVARPLGCTPMALYRHVRNKDELVALMVERALGEAPATPATTVRGRLSEWARALRAVLLAHPWLLHVPLSTMRFGPARASWFERALEAFETSPVAEVDKARLVLQLNVYVFGAVRLDTEGRRDDDAGATLTELLAYLDDRYAAVARVLAAEIESSSDEDFEFAIERILDGFDHYLARAR